MHVFLPDGNVVVAEKSHVLETLVRKKVPDYLLRIIDDYLSDRWVIYEGG